jgi:hypothetical protein
MRVVVGDVEGWRRGVWWRRRCDREGEGEFELKI